MGKNAKGFEFRKFATPRIIGGIAMGFSAWYQGKAGAAGSDALAETGQGFGNYLTVLGIVETVALFVMNLLTARRDNVIPAGLRLTRMGG